MKIRLTYKEFLFLFVIYLLGVSLRLIPRLFFHPELLTFQADIWYRLCLAQYVVDHGALPVWDIRYAAYGQVPFWYNPLAVHGFAFLSNLTKLSLPVVTSRLLPFIESFTAISIYFLCRKIYSQKIAKWATIFLSLTPSFIYWSNIGTPQSYTVFFIPIYILLWISFVNKEYILSSRLSHLLIMGLLFAINFLMHLTFFNVVIILFLVHMGLIAEGKAAIKDFASLALPFVISQVLTIWWWGPHQLYFWWTQALSTSTAFFGATLFLKNYGHLSGVLGHLAFFYLIFLLLKKGLKSRSFYMVPMAWVLFPLIESHMEWFLLLLNKQALCWNAMLRPIEGFRFYSFLAQPLAVCMALAFREISKMKVFLKLRPKGKQVIYFVVIVSLFLNFFIGFNYIDQITVFQINLRDIQAAKWYRQNSDKSARILTDYYNAQLFSGICAGKALLGMMFPLKKVNYPYISNSYTVLYDIHELYKTDDISIVENILDKYNCTHIYFSNNALRYIEFLVDGSADGEDLKNPKYDKLLSKDYSKTLLNKSHFNIVYTNQDTKILEWKKAR